MTESAEGRSTLIAGIAGVLWPVLAMVRIPLTGVLDQPSWEADRSLIADFYQSANFDTAFVVGMWAVTIAYLLFLVFVTKIADSLTIRGGRSRWMGYMIVAGAAIDTALVYAYLAPFAAAVFWAGHGGLSADTYLALHGLSFSVLWIEMVTITLWMIPLGLGIIHTAMFPKWLGWAFLANSAASLIVFFLPYEAWTIISGLPYLWVLIAAVFLLARPGRLSPPEETPTPPLG